MANIRFLTHGQHRRRLSRRYSGQGCDGRQAGHGGQVIGRSGRR